MLMIRRAAPVLNALSNMFKIMLKTVYVMCPDRRVNVSTISAMALFCMWSMTLSWIKALTPPLTRPVTRIKPATVSFFLNDDLPVINTV